MSGIKSRLVGKSRISLVTAGAAIIFCGGIATTAMSEPVPIVGTSTNSQHTYLTFSSHHETTATAKAYMQAIDPGATKVNFVDWLVNAGFISQASEWKPTGQQVYTNVPGDYGYGKVNAFAHMIILNAADLGFIRNQYIRCKPDCKTKGAKVYTYLENYGSTQFDSNGVKQQNNAAAVSIALERRDGAPPTGRIADVAFEWAPASNGSSPTTNFGQLYAYVVQPRLTNIQCPAPTAPTGTPVLDVNGNPVVDELYTWPDNGGTDQAFWDCKFNTRSLTTQPTEFLNPRPDQLVYSNDDFAPELDALGTKPMPGVCFICHGGDVPSNIQNTLFWPNSGKVTDFRFLPADGINAVFGADDTAAPLVTGATGANMTRAGQETELKKYNQAVAITQGATPPKNAFFAADGTIAGGNWTVPKARDDQGVTRPSHGLEVIFGWYAGFPGDLSMSFPSQQDSFTPAGWPQTGPANVLYHKVVVPSCRSCHMNRELSLDFGTLNQFDNNKGNVEQLVFQPQCDSNMNKVTGNKIVMPLARVTWNRFWTGIDQTTNIQFAPPGLPADDPNSQPFLLKQHFGYTATSYCAKQH